MVKSLRLSSSEIFNGMKLGRGCKRDVYSEENFEEFNKRVCNIFCIMNPFSIIGFKCGYGVAVSSTKGCGIKKLCVTIS